MKTIRFEDRSPDAGQYLDLFETTGWNKQYRANAVQLGEALDHSWAVVSAYDGDRLVGLGRVVSDGVLYGMIYDLIVRPSHQGRGIGTAILDKLIRRCRDAGLREIQLFSAKGKVGFYRNRGFMERPEEAPGMQLRHEGH